MVRHLPLTVALRVLTGPKLLAIWSFGPSLHHLGIGHSAQAAVPPLQVRNHNPA